MRQLRPKSSLIIDPRACLAGIFDEAGLKISPVVLSMNAHAEPESSWSCPLWIVLATILMYYEPEILMSLHPCNGANPFLI